MRIVHGSITFERIEESVRESMFGLESNGVCLNCGEEASSVEPDAEKYQCHSCGERAVYGWEQVLLLGFIGGSEYAD